MKSYIGGAEIETGIDPQAYDRTNPAQPKTVQQAQKPPQPAAKADDGPTPLLGKAAAAKAFQSATFGWGADALKATHLISEQNAKAIKEESAHYDHDNPWAAAGIDLAVAGITMAIPGVDAVAGGRAAVSVARAAGTAGRAIGEAVPLVGRAAGAIAETGVGQAVGKGAQAVGNAGARAADSMVGRGARYGGIQGAAQGAADAGEGHRMEGVINGGTKGAMQGAVVGGALGAVGSRLAKPVVGNKNIAPGFASLNEVSNALKKDGKTLADLNKWLDADTSRRIVDFPSPTLQKVVTSAAKRSEGAASKAESAIAEDAEGRRSRIVQGAGQALAEKVPGGVGLGLKKGEPLARARQEVSDNLRKLESEKDALYKQSRQEVLAVSPELRDILQHTDVKPLVKDSLADYHNLRKTDAASDVAKAPKYKVGEEIPSAVLDDVIRKVGAEMQKEGTGSVRYGSLKAAQNALKGQVTGTLAAARTANATLGKAANQTGLLGAQDFGAAFVKGFKGADMKTFDAMSDVQKKHVAFGALNSLDDYLRHAPTMGVAGIKRVSSALASDETKKILGSKVASEARKVFEQEAARMRTNAKVAGAAANASDEEVGKTLTGVAIKGLGHAFGAGHAASAAAHWLVGQGIPKGTAEKLVETAMKPGGMAELKSKGTPRKVLEKLYAMRGTLAPRVVNQNQRAASSFRDGPQGRQDDNGPI